MILIGIFFIAIPIWALAFMYAALNWGRLLKVFNQGLLTRKKKEYNIPLSKIS